jgi:hypothetical protein
LRAVGERDLEDAGGCAERGQRLHRTERVEQWAPDRGCLRRAGDHQAVGIRHQELNTGVARMLLVHLIDDAAHPARELGIGQAIVALEPRRQHVCREIEIADDVGDRLPAMIIDLHQGADRHGEQKSDDQNGYRPPQRGFSIEQTAIGRLRDRLREPLDRVRTC